MAAGTLQTRIALSRLKQPSTSKLPLDDGAHVPHLQSGLPSHLFSPHKRSQSQLSKLVTRPILFIYAHRRFSRSSTHVHFLAIQHKWSLPESNPSFINECKNQTHSTFKRCKIHTVSPAFPKCAIDQSRRKRLFPKRQEKSDPSSPSMFTLMVFTAT